LITVHGHGSAANEQLQSLCLIPLCLLLAPQRKTLQAFIVVENRKRLCDYGTIRAVHLMAVLTVLRRFVHWARNVEINLWW